MSDDPLLTIPVPFRDWLASKALLGTLKANSAGVLPEDVASMPWRVPSGHYAVADLMIEVRGGADVPASLRDYFAGEIVQLLLPARFPKGVGNDPGKALAQMRSLAEDAYKMADRMVAARGANGG